VESGGLSVEALRDWSQKAEDNAAHRLLVAKNTAKWQTDPSVEGVFVQVVNGTKLPTTGTPPPGCQPDTTPDGGQTADGQQLATFRYDCSGPSVTEQFRQLNSSTQLQIQVRDDNSTTRETVVNSVQYKP